jgi:NhaA family Na+:H+ antiporter
LKVFVTALAIADDIGAVLVIALFYTSEISWIWLIVSAGIFVALIGLNRARVYEPWPYAVLGFGLWFAFLQSGIHPTIAGVLLATTIPTRNPPNTGALLAQCVSVLDEFEDPASRRTREDDKYQAAAQTLEVVADRMQSPAQRLEHVLHPWTTYLILPIFALANAGVQIQFDLSLFGPISIGILLGLVIGKALGITILSWLSIRLGLAELPRNVSWRQLFSVSWLAGIGFTMSLFIANAAFVDPELLDQAKIGIIIASVFAGVIGFVLMLTSSPTHAETSHMEPAPATD